MAAAAARDVVELLFLTPEALGGGAHPDQRQQSAPLLHAEAGSSTGAGLADREVPAGPRSSPTHAIQDGAAGAPAGAGIAAGGPDDPRAKKKKTAKKGGAKAAAARTVGTSGKDRRGRTKGPACPPDYFEDVIRKEWANPGGGNSLLSVAKRFYSLPERIMEDLKVPLIDAPVVALHSGAILPKDGENALRDAFDKKNEAALKKSHEAMSLAIRSAAALSNFTRATAIWADNLLQNPEVSPLVLRRTLLKMKRAAEFAADASQDNIQFCARAQAANITIRRNIWLKHWRVDSLSKSNLATEKFSGRLLFGESNLDKVLVETREKKKAMPSSSYRREGDGKSRSSHSFRNSYNAGRGRDTRDRTFKSFKFGTRNPNKQTPNYRPGKGPNPKKPPA
ncbi:UNVERIFIED_CONTAM: hypothetical protein K2H54_062161 [Gekko kuhli]